MVKSFFGLDVKTGAKVALWTHLIENLSLYILSLLIMLHMSNNTSRNENFAKFGTVLPYQNELERHVKFRKAHFVS